MKRATRRRVDSRPGRTVLALLALLPLLGTSGSCRRNSAVEPAKVEIEWPDAAPYEVAGEDASPAIAPADGPSGAAAETSDAETPGASAEKPATGDSNQR